MSTGPTRKCMSCGVSLDINDPLNGGYCGGHLCKLDPQFVPVPPYDFKAKRKPVFRGTRKQRRAAEAMARKAKRVSR